MNTSTDGPVTHDGAIVRLDLPHPVPVVLWLVQDLDRWDAAEVAGQACSAQEQERAQRFRLPVHRARYLAARSALRRVLGARLGLRPSQVALSEGRHGKPGLAQGAPPWFNLSHHEALCVIATCEAADVGVDVESANGRPDLEGLATVSMTETERDALARAHPERREEAFLVAWTRKEASLKAIGCGMRVDPTRLHAGTEPSIATIGVDAPEGPRQVLVGSHLLEHGVVISIATTLPDP